MNFRQTVLQEGMNIFQRHGIRNLTMEEIISELDISKGSLFEIAKSKTELLDQCLDESLMQRKTEFAAVVERADNTVEALSELLKTHLKAMADFHPEFIPDLKKNHAKCWQKMQDFFENNLLAYFTELLNMGLEQGLFKPEINAALLSKLLLSQTYAIIENGLLQQNGNNFGEVFKLAFHFHLHGLLTDKGLFLLEALKPEPETETAHVN